MESSKITKIITIFLKILFTLLSVGVCGYGVLLFFELKYIIEYRNYDYVQLDRTIHWPELVNGLYMGVGAVVAIASCCFIYVTKNKNLLVASCVSLAISVLALASLATLTLVMCEQETDAYLKENLMSVFDPLVVPKPGALERFHEIEEYYHCCGVKNIKDYTGLWKNGSKLAGLCCEGNKDVEACKTEAAVRNGCQAVVSSKFYDRYLCGTVICSLTAAVGFIDLILSFVLLRIRKKNVV